MHNELWVERRLDRSENPTTGCATPVWWSISLTDGIWQFFCYTTPERAPGPRGCPARSRKPTRDSNRPGVQPSPAPPTTMNAVHLLEKTDAYVGSEWLGKHPVELSPTIRPFVTLTRESGSGGTRLARLLARELNAGSPAEICWSVSDGTITTQMLKMNHLPTRLSRFLPEDRLSEINASVGELVGLHPSLWDLVQKTNQTLRQLARQGYAILVGRGANFATAGLPGGVHVRLVAPPEHRARYYAQLYDLSEKEALAFNAKRDAAARRYVRATFDAEISDPAAYDLMINMAHVSFEQAAQLVLAQVHSWIHADAPMAGMITARPG